MIVFDTSTLILLAIIEFLDLFITNVRGSVIIPEKVRSEAVTEGKEEVQSIIRLLQEKKISVVKVKNFSLRKKLMEDFSIEAGEAASLALALEHKSAIIATDDRNAIRACKMLKLEFITAVTVLVRAVEKGIIDKDEGLVKLQKLQAVGRYSKTIIEDAVRLLKGGS
jgi:predicted nucleic acid-binding protein